MATRRATGISSECFGRPSEASRAMHSRRTWIPLRGLPGPCQFLVSLLVRPPPSSLGPPQHHLAPSSVTHTPPIDCTFSSRAPRRRRRRPSPSGAFTSSRAPPCPKSRVDLAILDGVYIRTPLVGLTYSHTLRRLRPLPRARPARASSPATALTHPDYPQCSRLC